MSYPLTIVAAALVSSDPPPITILNRQGFEADALRVDAGHYRLFLSENTLVDPLSSIVLVTPAVNGCLFQGTMTDDRTVDLAFTDADGNPRDAQFSVAVIRVSIP